MRPIQLRKVDSLNSSSKVKKIIIEPAWREKTLQTTLSAVKFNDYKEYYVSQECQKKKFLRPQLAMAVIVEENQSVKSCYEISGFEQEEEGKGRSSNASININRASTQYNIEQEQIANHFVRNKRRKYKTRRKDRNKCQMKRSSKDKSLKSKSREKKQVNYKSKIAFKNYPTLLQEQEEFFLSKVNPTKSVTMSSYPTLSQLQSQPQMMFEKQFYGKDSAETAETMETTEIADLVENTGFVAVDAYQKQQVDTNDDKDYKLAIQKKMKQKTAQLSLKCKVQTKSKGKLTTLINSSIPVSKKFKKTRLYKRLHGNYESGLLEKIGNINLDQYQGQPQRAKIPDLLRGQDRSQEILRRVKEIKQRIYINLE